MELLEQILNKHQHRSFNGLGANHNYLNFKPYQKDVRIKKYKAAHSDTLTTPKDLTNRTESCQLKQNKKLDKSTTWRNDPSKDSFDMMLTQRSTQSKLSQLNQKALNNMSDYLNTQYHNWPKTIPKKQFSITIYSSKSKNYSASGSNDNKFARERSKSKYEPLQLKVNRFPIMRKKQSKRKQIAEAFNLKPHYTPQLEHLVKQKKPLVPLTSRSSMAPRREERAQICGWQEVDPYEYEQ